MSSSRAEPFAQDAIALPDGRTAVEVAIFDPFLVRVVLVAASKHLARHDRSRFDRGWVRNSDAAP